jgi:Fic family protein
MDVRVGNYTPPPGGPDIRVQLAEILGDMETPLTDPYSTHLDYEKLHPLMDGNGRTGRALWLWQHLRAGTYKRLGFFHQWYYETLG